MGDAPTPPPVDQRTQYGNPQRCHYGLKNLDQFLTAAQLALSPNPPLSCDYQTMPTQIQLPTSPFNVYSQLVAVQAASDYATLQAVLPWIWIYEAHGWDAYIGVQIMQPEANNAGFPLSYKGVVYTPNAKPGTRAVG